MIGIIENIDEEMVIKGKKTQKVCFLELEKERKFFLDGIFLEFFCWFCGFFDGFFCCWGKGERDLGKME